MTIENIPWSISMKECCQLGKGWTCNLLITTRIQRSHRVGCASNWATEAGFFRLLRLLPSLIWRWSETDNSTIMDKNCKLTWIIGQPSLPGVLTFGFWKCNYLPPFPWGLCLKTRSAHSFNPSLAKHDMPCLSRQCRSRSVGFCLSFNMWISIKNPDQVICLAGN